MNKPRKTKLSEIFFWSHFLIFAGWFLPFFIPVSVWSNKIYYHVWYMIFVLSINYVWGFVFLLKLNKYVIACPWTTITQWLRGFDITNPKNYNHSFVLEISEMWGVNMKGRYVTFVMYVSIMVAGIQLYLS